MAREYFWYNPGAKEVGAIPTGSKTGQFIFLSAQTPVDLETGKVIQNLRDLPEEDRNKLATEHEFVNLHTGPIKAQTWTIYQNISKILKQQGSSLDNIITQRIFLPDLRDTSHMEGVMLSFFPDYKPATTIVGVADRGLYYGVRVWVDVIAIIPKKGGPEKEAIYVPELESITQPYPQAVKVGQFLFLEGIMGLDPKSREPITRISALGADAAKISLNTLLGDATTEANKAQLWLTYKHIEKILANQGAGLKDILRLNSFHRHGMKELTNRYPVQLAAFGRTEAAPALSTCIIHNLSVIPQLEIITRGVALLPGQVHKETGEIPDWCEAVSAEWAKADPFYFPSGNLGYDKVKHQSIISLADITDNGRFLAQNRIDDSQTTMAKVWYTYGMLGKTMKSANTNLFNTLHQSIFMVEPSEWPLVERIAQVVFKGQIPPTTIIPCDEVAYHFRQDLPPYIPPNELVRKFRITETMEIEPTCVVD